MTDTELEALLKATEGHTAGHWLVEAVDPKERQYLDVRAASGRMVAEVVLAPGQDHEANARLIAAAPTLRAEVVRLLVVREAAERALMLVISSPGWTELTESDRAAVRVALAALAEVKS